MKRKNKTIIVTGGAGFIGSHLVGVLLHEKKKVLVIDNFSSGRMANLKDYKRDKNLTVIKADILDKNRMFRLLKNSDRVYHLATTCLRISIANPELTHEVNSTGTLNMCQAALANGVRQFIYVSSSEIYGSARYVPMDENHPCEPRTVYAASKLAGEHYCKSYYTTYGLPVIIVRPFNTYGPREHFHGPYGEVIPRFAIRALGGMRPVVFGDGCQKRDFTYVTEVADGIVKASTCDNLIGEAVNIAYGRAVSLKELAGLIIDAAGRKGFGISYKAKRPGDVESHHADVSKAARILGFRPRIDIERGIAKYIDWLKRQNLNLKKYIKESGCSNW